MTGSEWFESRPGGLNRYFEDLALALQRRDDVTLESYAFGEPMDGGSTWGRLGGSLAMRVLASARVDVRGAIVDRHFALYGPDQRLTRRKAAAFFIHFHGPWYAESALAGASRLTARAKHFAEWVRYQGADGAVVLSDAFKDVLVQEFRLRAESVHVIPPGVDLDRFTSTPLPEGPPTVLCVRRLERRMGLDVLLEAWPQVTAAIPHAELVIAGVGSEERTLRVAAANLTGVKFVGRLTDAELVDAYSRCGVTVVPTRALEGFGLIALESLASGRAPVVTDIGGLPDSVKGLDPTLIVPSENSEALAARLVTALLGGIPNPAVCRSHAERFSWSLSAERHMKLYGA